MNEVTPRTPAQALEALDAGYARFLEDLIQARKTSLNEAVEFFLRYQGNPRVGAVLDAFAEGLTAHVEELRGLLAACTAEEADGFAAQALERMLFYPKPVDQSVAFSLMAFEGFSAPLLPFLSPEHRAELAKRYQKRNPRRRMLANQKKLLQQMNEN